MNWNLFFTILTTIALTGFFIFWIWSIIEEIDYRKMINRELEDLRDFTYKYRSRRSDQIVDIYTFNDKVSKEINMLKEKVNQHNKFIKKIKRIKGW